MYYKICDTDLKSYNAYRYSLVVKDIKEYTYHNKKDIDKFRKKIVKSILECFSKNENISTDDNINFKIINIYNLKKDLYRIVYNLSSVLPNGQITKIKGNAFISLNYQIILLNNYCKNTYKIIELIENYIKSIPVLEDCNLFSLGINAIIDEDEFIKKILNCDNIKELTFNLRGPNLFDFNDKVNEDIHKLVGHTDTNISFKNDSGNLKIEQPFLSYLFHSFKELKNGLGSLKVKSKYKKIDSNNYARNVLIEDEEDCDEIENKMCEIHKNEGSNPTYETTT